VICLGTVVFVSIGKWPGSSYRQLSLEIGSSLVELICCRTVAVLTLDKSGGNNVQLINGPVSEFGDSWYKNWTSALMLVCSTAWTTI